MSAQLLRKWYRLSTIAKFILSSLLAILLILGGKNWLAMRANSHPAISIQCDRLIPNQIYRYIATLDTCLTPMSDRDIEEKLNDPFATTLLRQGIFPSDAHSLSAAIADSPLGYQPTSYVVGEGFQIPLTTISREEPRSLRYVVTWGPTENKAPIMLGTSAPIDPTAAHDIISWDTVGNKFNFYSLRHQADDKTSPLAWSWAGDSTFAPQPPTAKDSCFNCHHTGLPIMKELEAPWNNWNSQRAIISSELVPRNLAKESFFRERRNADILEHLIRGEFQNYYQNWLDARSRQEGKTIHLVDISQILHHLTVNTTINLKSSEVQSAKKNTSGQNIPGDGENINAESAVTVVDITGVPPVDTFLSDTIFQFALGLDYSPLSVTLPREDYEAYLKQHDFALVGSKSSKREEPALYRYNGSTYFAYFLPQISAEDMYMTRQLLKADIVSEKFVAALLMVDFKNPVFSEKRASLQKYAEEISTATIINGVSSLPEDFASKIKAVAKPCQSKDFETCTPEEQFLYTWELPENRWKAITSTRLQTYVDEIASLDPEAQLNYLMYWSIQQRDRFASTLPFCKLFEFKPLIPETSLSQLSPCLAGDEAFVSLLKNN